MQLLPGQIPKVQKYSQAKSLFCTFGIWAGKSCEKNVDEIDNISRMAWTYIVPKYYVPNFSYDLQLNMIESDLRNMQTCNTYPADIWHSFVQVNIKSHCHETGSKLVLFFASSLSVTLSVKFYAPPSQSSAPANSCFLEQFIIFLFLKNN